MSGNKPPIIEKAIITRKSRTSIDKMEVSVDSNEGSGEIMKTR